MQINGKISTKTERQPFTLKHRLKLIELVVKQRHSMDEELTRTRFGYLRFLCFVLLFYLSSATESNGLAHLCEYIRRELYTYNGTQVHGIVVVWMANSEKEPSEHFGAAQDTRKPCRRNRERLTWKKDERKNNRRRKKTAYKH